MYIRLTFKDFFQIKKKTEFSCAIFPCPLPHTHTMLVTNAGTHNKFFRNMEMSVGPDCKITWESLLEN